MVSWYRPNVVIIRWHVSNPLPYIARVNVWHTRLHLGISGQPVRPTRAITCPSRGFKRTCAFPTQVSIPFFKDVVIMSNSCDSCGYKNSELKPGGAIPDRGRTITLHVCDPVDLTRDVIKSDTCVLSIPEIELELSTGTWGGLVTTVEGLFAYLID